jgi:MFS family permease
MLCALPTGPDGPVPYDSDRPTLRQLKEIPAGVYALLLGGMFTTMAVVGQTTILGKAVFDITGSTLSLGFLGLAEFLPTAILAPLTGPIADRFDRRKVLAIGLVGEAAASFILFLYIQTDPTSVTPIFAIVIFFGAARALVAPAGRALPIDLAPPALVQRVVALNSVGFQIGIIIGPIIAGFLFVVDKPLPYLFATAAILVAASLLLAVPDAGVEKLVNAPGARSALRQARDGLLFVRRTPILFGAISLDLFAVLFGGAVALLPAIADERLGVGAVGLGWLRAAAGIGAGLTAIALAARPLSRHVGRRLLVAVAIFGLATIVLGLTRSYALAFVALMVLSASDAVSVFIRLTLVPIATAESMRGRVLAVENVFIGASNELGAFESGVAAHFIGLVGAVVFGGAATLAVVAVWWARFPALRDVDRFDEVRPERAPP